MVDTVHLVMNTMVISLFADTVRIPICWRLVQHIPFFTLYSFNDPRTQISIYYLLSM
jgi:hypothetical protein